uniref:Solute carrier family 25 member 45 n=2 Tax=Canis lupus familiaris TaxID=9615 RepID=A0A8I3PMR9_CANLF
MPVEEFVAGWISGALGLVLGHPFDTVKVRLQTQTTYQGIIDCMVKTYRHESLLGFFKGMSFPIASIAVVNSVLFGVYSNTLLALTATSHQERWAQPPSYTHVFIAGCTGGFVQAYCLAPFDLIKVRLQNQTEPRARPGSPPPRYRGPVHCAVSICREDGPWGLFRGAWALTLRDTPTLGIYFVTYEWLCRQSTPDRQNPGEWSGMRGWGTERSGAGSWPRPWRMQRDAGDGMGWEDAVAPQSDTCLGFLYPRRSHSAGGRGLCRHCLLGCSHPLGRDQVPDADGRAEAQGVPGGAGLHGKQCPAGRTGGLLPGAYNQQCPRLSCERCHLPHLRVPPQLMGMSVAR